MYITHIEYVDVFCHNDHLITYTASEADRPGLSTASTVISSNTVFSNEALWT